jgi:hypothetical protein
MLCHALVEANGCGESLHEAVSGFREPASPKLTGFLTVCHDSLPEIIFAGGGSLPD